MKPTIVHVEPYSGTHLLVENALPDANWVHFTDHMKAAKYLATNHEDVHLVISHLRKALKISEMTEAAIRLQAEEQKSPRGVPGQTIVSMAREWNLPLIVHASDEEDWERVKAPGILFVRKPMAIAKLTLAIKRALHQSLPPHIVAFVPEEKRQEQMDWDIKRHGVVVFSDIKKFQEHVGQNGDLIKAAVIDMRHDKEGHSETALEHAAEFGIPTIARVDKNVLRERALKKGATRIFTPSGPIFENRELNELIDKTVRK